MDKKINRFLSQIRQQVTTQTHYGQHDDVPENTQTRLGMRTCQQCGAGRSAQDGLTHCSYCGFEFHSGELSDGIHIKKHDNSL